MLWSLGVAEGVHSHHSALVVEGVLEGIGLMLLGKTLVVGILLKRL